MRIPVVKGTIKRRLLLNFRAVPEVVQRILPSPFRPKLHKDHAIVGVCLIRLENIRPTGVPEIMGVSSENAAHRIAVEWQDEAGIQREGVFIPRRDTGSLLNLVAGGRLFPGEHNAARFEVEDVGTRIDFNLQSKDGQMQVRVLGQEANALPADSCFSDVKEASTFFEGGSIGYSVTRDSNRLDGLRLQTLDWKVSALHVSEVYSSYFSDQKLFPEGTVQFDHALIMRNLLHEWHQEKDL